MVIAVDFDGTCVAHEYPEVGADVPNACAVLQALSDNDVKIILWTMRSGEALADAVRWFAERNIKLWGINKNPEQSQWTESPKVYAQLYIDDAAAGCPFIQNGNARPFVDWIKIAEILRKDSFLEIKDDAAMLAALEGR